MYAQFNPLLSNVERLLSTYVCATTVRQTSWTLPGVIFPRFFVTFRSLLGFTAIDFRGMLPLKCIFDDFSFYTRLMFISLSPLVLTALLGIVAVIKTRRLYKRREARLKRKTFQASNEGVSEGEVEGEDEAEEEDEDEDEDEAEDESEGRPGNGGSPGGSPSGADGADGAGGADGREVWVRAYGINHLVTLTSSPPAGPHPLPKKNDHTTNCRKY